MLSWPRRPIIYEINTVVWLQELSRREGKLVTLGTVPTQEWDALALYGFDAVWLMGVWERSPAGIRIARGNSGLHAEFGRALSDYQPEDIVGSAYCIRRYVVDDQLGGPNGLAAARKMLADRGMRLILDFVPNHVAPDHPWIMDHPQYFIQGTADDLAAKPGSSSRRVVLSSRTAGIRISHLGRMWLNSMRSVPRCARLPLQRCLPLPSSATGCAAIWPCS